MEADIQKDQLVKRSCKGPCLPAATEVNDSIFELDRPRGNPSMQLLFFHGLQLEDYSNPHISTWESGDGSCIWPQKWLVEEFPGAHVLYVSYDGRVGEKFRESVSDMDIIAENLISDLMHANVGQFPNCPVILIGHSVGGLVIKRMCYEAHKLLNMKAEGLEREKLQNFLNSLKGIFFYGTPHHGSPVAKKAIEEYGGPLLDYFKLFSKHTARLNQMFDHICRKYNWRIEGVGESNPTKWGSLGNGFIAPEGSARQGSFNVVDGTDHFTISKPMTTKTRSFYKLRDLLSDIAKNVEEECKQQVLGNFQHLPHGMVQTDFVMDDIKAKLRDFRTIGLVGMGGVGKSTLAKAIFNELCPDFEYSCFVADVKLKQGSDNDIQEEVLKLMHYKGKTVGDKLALSALDGKRLLLVFDDISISTRNGEEEVLSVMRNVTTPESRFIVTSREEDLVKSLLGEPYRVPFLNDDEAHKLFKSHAFPGKKSPPKALHSHMETIVTKCEGLPLTLTVLGKYLKDKRDERYWKETLQALVKAADVRNFSDRLWAKLRLSYDGLGNQEQQIFLDAATFFNGKYRYQHRWRLGDAKAAWRAAYGTSVTLWWQTLVDFCLVYDVKDNEYITVHEQLQSLGVKIAKEPSNDDSCRVWDAELGLQMLQSTDKMNGKKFHAFRASGISDRDRHDIHISSTTLSNLQQLHFFEAQNRIIIDGAEEQGSVPRELVLLKCVGPSLFNPALQNRLAILHVSGLEYLPDSMGQLSYLDQLTISESPHLRFLPESFSRLSSLRCLEIHGCSSLQTLPESIGVLNDTFGGLSSLSHLKFRSCKNLRTLPDSFGGLSSLTHLEFWSCGNLHTLPDSFGGLSLLSHLKFCSCKNLRTLPDSFSGLSSLSHLKFRSCKNLRTLPDSFSGLSSLSHLKFQSCENLRTLPDSFGALSSLSHLNFRSCKRLRALPDSFGGLSLLSHLELRGCKKLQTLPDSFGGVSCLKHLILDAESMPNSFEDLKNLRYLEIWLTSAASIQDSIKSLPSLRTLKLVFDGVGVMAYSLLPSWLKEPNAPASIGKNSRIEFQVQDGCFLVKR